MKRLRCRPGALFWSGLVLSLLLFCSRGEAAELLVADLNGDPYGFSNVGRILAFDATTGAYVRTVATGLTRPSGLTIGPGGSLFVADQNGALGPGEVLTFDPTQSNQTRASAGVFAGSLDAPGGLLYDRSDNSMFVSELGGAYNGEVVRHYNATGTLIASDGTAGAIGGGTGPTGRTGMALDANHDLYVGAFQSSTVLKFTAASHYATGSGANPNQFASGVNGPGQMLFRNGILLADAGLYSPVFGGSVVQIDGAGNVTPFIFGFAFNSGLVERAASKVLVSDIGAGGSDPMAQGHIGLYNIDTGAAVNAGFITLATVQAGIPGTTYFEPALAAPYFIPGDLDLTGQRSIADVRNLAGALSDLSRYQTSGDLSNEELMQAGDVNGDNRIDNADLQSLINRLANGGGGSIMAVPEPRGCLLAAVALVAAFGSRLGRHYDRSGGA